MFALQCRFTRFKDFRAVHSVELRSLRALCGMREILKKSTAYTTPVTEIEFDFAFKYHAFYF